MEQARRGVHGSASSCLWAPYPAEFAPRINKKPRRSGVLYPTKQDKLGASFCLLLTRASLGKGALNASKMLLGLFLSLQANALEREIAGVLIALKRLPRGEHSYLLSGAGSATALPQLSMPATRVS